MKITVRDIKERSMALSLLQESSSKVNIQYLFKNIKTRYNYNNAKTILENWSHLSKDEDIAIGRVLETFDAVCDNDSISNINNASKIIESNILHKVRSGKATRHLNNYKLGKFKIANTKMQNANNDNNNNNAKYGLAFFVILLLIILFTLLIIFLKKKNIISLYK